MSFFPDSTVASFQSGRKFGPSIEATTNLRNGALIARNSGENWSDVNGGTPVGVGAGALALPIVGGSISAFVRAAATVASAPIQEGREVSGNTSVSFTVAPADLLLTALLSADGTLTFTVSGANLGAAVGISGTTSFALTPNTPLLGALAGMFASGAIVTSSEGTLTAYGALSGDITPFTELSPEGLAAAVWNSLLADYQAVGTAGKALSTASSGGVDYDSMATATAIAVRANLAAELARIDAAISTRATPGDVFAAV